ncbi:MAG: hypothetical protein ACP5D2_02190 [Candidatus Nanoarchaeia archaeon]
MTKKKDSSIEELRKSQSKKDFTEVPENDIELRLDRKPPETVSPVAVTAESGSYRVPMHLELQSFISEKSLKKTEQIELFSNFEVEESEIKIGLSHLSDAGFNALEAFKKLIARYSFVGNRETEEIQSNTFGRTRYPRIEISKSEYYEEYGLERDSKGGFGGAQVLQTAQKGLLELTETQHMLITRKRWIEKGSFREEVTDILRIHSPLITVIEGYEGLTSQEAEKVEAGEEILKNSFLVIELSPVFTLDSDNYYLLRRLNKDKIIKSLSGRSTKTYFQLFNLTNYLEQRGVDKLEIGIDKLADITGLQSYIKSRHTAKLINRLKELMRLATDGETKWLLSWSYANKKFTLELNPKLCSRVKKKNSGKAHKKRDTSS